jgi:DNA-binding NarL/FixJ family response regulator
MATRSADFEVSGCASSVDEILEKARSNPQVILISANLGDGALAGFNALRELHVKRVPSSMVMLFDALDQDLVIASFRGGAKGVFFRDKPVELLCKCIQRVHEGQVWAGSNELQLLLRALSVAFPLRSVAPARGVLSKREEEIMELVSQGMTNREVSRKLHLSEHTVKNHLFRLFEKLGISNRVELTLYNRDRDRVA